jgi:hypothetical protein
MTVFYQTGVASSPGDLMTKLTTFIESHGWIIDATAGGGVVIHNGDATGGAIVAGVNVTATEWVTRGAEQPNTALAWNLQPGHANTQHTCNWGAGPFVAYHFYVGDEDGSEYCHVSVEVTAGHFRHWALGELVRAGTVVGGTYCDSAFLVDNDNFKNSPAYNFHRHLCDASCSDGAAHLLVDYDGKVGGTWQSCSHASNTATNLHTGINRQDGMIFPQMYIGYQRWNGRTPGWPMMYFANRASNLKSPIGRMPNIRSISMRNFFPGELVTVGPSTWKVFPVFQKYIENNGAAPATITSSWIYGYAHLMP